MLFNIRPISRIYPINEYSHVRNTLSCSKLIKNICYLQKTFQLNQRHLSLWYISLKLDFKKCYDHIDKVIKMMKMNSSDLYNHMIDIGIDLKIVLFPWILSILCVIVPL